MRNISAIAAILSLIVLVSAVLAQQAATPKPTEPKYTEITYSADMSSYRWEGNDRVLILKGNVKFAQGDTILTADKVDYLESTRTANASGNFKIVDNQNTITGNQCIVNFKEKKGAITGNVRMVSKPKPGKTTDSIQSQLKDETVTTCSSVDYYYKEKKAVIPSPVTIVQKSRTVTADSATYFGKEEKVQLVGNVKGRDDKDRHTFAAPKVTISLNESDQWMEAEKASGSFYVKDEEEEAPPAEEKPAVESPVAKP